MACVVPFTVLRKHCHCLARDLCTHGTMIAMEGGAHTISPATAIPGRSYTHSLTQILGEGNSLLHAMGALPMVHLLLSH